MTTFIYRYIAPSEINGFFSSFLAGPTAGAGFCDFAQIIDTGFALVFFFSNSQHFAIIWPFRLRYQHTGTLDLGSRGPSEWDRQHCHT